MYRNSTSLLFVTIVLEVVSTARRLRPLAPDEDDVGGGSITATRGGASFVPGRPTAHVRDWSVTGPPRTPDASDPVAGEAHTVGHPTRPLRAVGPGKGWCEERPGRSGRARMALLGSWRGHEGSETVAGCRPSPAPWMWLPSGPGVGARAKPAQGRGRRPGTRSCQRVRPRHGVTLASAGAGAVRDSRLLRRGSNGRDGGGGTGAGDTKLAPLGGVGT